MQKSICLLLVVTLFTSSVYGAVPSVGCSKNPEEYGPFEEHCYVENKGEVLVAKFNEEKKQPMSHQELKKSKRSKKDKVVATEVFLKEKAIHQMETELKKGVRVVTREGAVFPINVYFFKYLLPALGIEAIGTGLAMRKHVLQENKTLTQAFRASSGWVSASVITLLAAGFLYLAGHSTKEVVYLTQEQRDKLSDQLLDLKRQVEFTKTYMTEEAKQEYARLKSDDRRGNAQPDFLAPLEPKELKPGELLTKIKLASETIEKMRKELNEGVRFEQGEYVWYEIPNLLVYATSWLAFYPIVFLGAQITPHFFFPNVNMQEVFNKNYTAGVDNFAGRNESVNRVWTFAKDFTSKLFGVEKIKKLALAPEIDFKVMGKQAAILAGLVVAMNYAKKYQTPSGQVVILSEYEKKELETALDRTQEKLKKLVKLYEVSVEYEVRRDKEINLDGSEKSVDFPPTFPPVIPAVEPATQK